MKKDYSNYKLDDFLLDEDFIVWIKNGNHQSSEEWQHFLMDTHLHGEQFTEAVNMAKILGKPDAPVELAHKERIWKEILEKKGLMHSDEGRVIRMRRVWRVVGVAAILLMVMAGAAWFGGFYERNGKSSEIAGLVNDALPGKDKATLTLEDGRVIELDAAANGNLTSSGSITVVKKGGMISYEVKEATGETTGATAYHTLSTPRGGQFSVALPDGSLVWLNAASSLRFPAAFAANERRVEITGEAYFEVSKDEDRPFRVITSGTEVEVLGTSFNVMAYTNEPRSRTTLLEGVVKMKLQNSETLLKPGEQAVVAAGNIQVKNEVDTEEVTAWKDGSFRFNRSDLPVVMRQLERWYDVEVKYESGIPTGKLTGDFPRTMKLSEVLKVLKLSGFNATIKDKTIYMN